MPEQELKRILEQLHAELNAADTLNEEQVMNLRATVAEIQSALDRSDGSSASLGARLKDTLEDFEGAHPTLTKTVAQVADILAQMGI